MINTNANLNSAHLARITGVLVAVATGILLAGIAMPTAAADHTNSSETETCEVNLDQFEVLTVDSIIDGADDPARVGVTALAGITNECPVVVQISFNIPNDMYYQGTSASSSGRGLQTEILEVNPGNTASFTTAMYSNRSGSRNVTANVEYFPKGQPDDARSIDSLVLSFDVQEPVPQEEWPGPEEAVPVDDGPVDDAVDDGPVDDDIPCGVLCFIANNPVVVLIIIVIGSAGVHFVKKRVTILKT
jgi:hypothetical protein